LFESIALRPRFKTVKSGSSSANAALNSGAVVIDHGEKGLLTPVVRAVYDAVHRQRIKSFVIDLAVQRQAGNAHGIVGCEAPEKWQIKPERYLA
jgi:hypothetical protein